MAIDREFLHSKSEQFKEVFATFEILGWYTVGTEVTSEHIMIHRQMSVPQTSLQLEVFFLCCVFGAGRPD